MKMRKNKWINVLKIEEKKSIDFINDEEENIYVRILWKMKKNKWISFLKDEKRKMRNEFPEDGEKLETKKKKKMNFLKYEEEKWRHEPSEDETKTNNFLKEN